MSIVDVKKMWSKDSGTVRTEDGRTWTARFTEGWSILHSADATMLEICSAAGLPAAGQPYPGTDFVLAKSWSPSRVGPIYSVGVIEYEGEVGGPGGSGAPGSSPITSIGPKITWSDTETDEPIDQDFDGNPILNVNGEPIEGLTTKLPDQTVTIQRNFLAIDTYAIRRYRRSVNSDTFLGWPPGTVHLTGYSALNVYSSGGQGYWDVTANFTFREPYNTTADHAWYKRVRHEGYTIRETAGADPIPAPDGHKGTTRIKVLLKNDGTRETNPANAVWLEFKQYEPLPYNSLGLL